MAEVGIRRKLRKRKWTDYNASSNRWYYDNIITIRNYICNNIKCNIGSHIEVVTSKDEYGRQSVAYGIKDNTPAMIINGKQHMIELILIESISGGSLGHIGHCEIKLGLYRLNNDGREQMIISVKRRGQSGLSKCMIIEAVADFVDRIKDKMQ